MALSIKSKRLTSVTVDLAVTGTFYPPLFVVNIATIASNRVLFVALPKFSNLETNYTLWPLPVISMR